MTDNAQKTPLQRSITAAAAKQALDKLALTGRVFPCSVVAVSGSIVTVKFEVNSPNIILPGSVQMPLFGPRYVRYPIQVGDKGIALSADVYIGGMSGLGGGTADLTQRSNLSSLVFLPIGSSSWGAVDPNAVVVSGPNGVTLQDDAKASTITLTPSSGIAIQGNAAVSLDSNSTIALKIAGVTLFTLGSGNLEGTGSIITSGDVVAGGVSLRSHTHSGVATGGGDTGPPVT